ncbi:uncharacterized protein N7483_002604 [Penicillium malachiteum]|uniref:uncharacterized protein n=1 Tax=Penicillium malachiteum TaxID=1324776 RepID=UPI002547D7DE|nr:uncharacterized protein N7483_002604 [Penicillium malachiteum]KAJ5737479.1 hypothetical protein N7483_002604 [Penicillium malachiteum]
MNKIIALSTHLARHDSQNLISLTARPRQSSIQGYKGQPADYWVDRCHDCGKSDHRKHSRDCIVEQQRQQVAAQERQIAALQQEIEEKDRQLVAAIEMCNRESARGCEYLKMATDAQGELARTFGRLFDAEKKLEKQDEGGE